MNDPRRWELPSNALARAFDGGPLASAIEPLRSALAARGPALLHGDLPRWQAALDALPVLQRPRLEANGAVVVGTDHGTRDGMPDGSQALDERERASRAALRQLGPWRKGPFRLDGVDIDTEWRSDRKWARLLPHIAPLRSRCVLDVGSGSGYHLWRMHAAGAAAVLGVEPMLLFDAQFRAVARYAPEAAVQQLPLRLADLPAQALAFDTVFSMGVLYHARLPHDHLAQLCALLRPGGQLVLDTLVLDCEPDCSLALSGRYAGMRNISELPSPARLHRWLADSGFDAMRTVSLGRTSVEEQRSTDWSGPHSLIDALSPHDPTLTRESHPAPCRAIVICAKPVTV